MAVAQMNRSNRGAGVESPLKGSAVGNWPWEKPFSISNPVFIFLLVNLKLNFKVIMFWVFEFMYN